MNKELFLETMNYINHLSGKNELFNNTLRTLDKEFGGGYIYSETIDFLANMLKELTHDVGDNISYFLWELDFGKNYYDGCITEQDGTIIPMKTPEDVWNLIQSDNVK